MTELLDMYGSGRRELLTFRRPKVGDIDPLKDHFLGDSEAMVVGRGISNLKLIGDYMTKFDGVSITDPMAPKPSIGEIHRLPDARPDFAWRVRANLYYGSNMPETESGLPSIFLEFGWSDSDLNSDPNQIVFNTAPDRINSLVVDNNVNPVWNQ